MFVAVNVALFVFNLIPLAPLDGFRVFSGFVGRTADRLVYVLGTYGPMILLVLLMVGYVSPRLDILGRGLSQGMNAVMRLLLG
jgi:Zn-dependent protease